jgi:hypothetical protein
MRSRRRDPRRCPNAPARRLDASRVRMDNARSIPPGVSHASAPDRRRRRRRALVVLRPASARTRRRRKLGPAESGAQHEAGRVRRQRQVVLRRCGRAAARDPQSARAGRDGSAGAFARAPCLEAGHHLFDPRRRRLARRPRPRTAAAGHLGAVRARWPADLFPARQGDGRPVRTGSRQRTGAPPHPSSESAAGRSAPERGRYAAAVQSAIRQRCRQHRDHERGRRASARTDRRAGCPDRMAAWCSSPRVWRAAPKAM